jgi:hypothetical protein
MHLRPGEVHLAAAEKLVPAEIHPSPEEVRLAASEMLVPAIMHLKH